MRILIVEDEEMTARRLKRLVTEIVDNQTTALECLATLEEAKSYVANHAIDLLFIDLNLNGEDGFELLASLTGGDIPTIIVSANTDQALKSYDYGVLDFVAKPFSKERLEKAIGRFRNRNGLNPQAGRGSNEYIQIRYGTKKRLLQANDIACIEGANKYSEIHLLDGVSYLHENALKHLLLELRSNFQRVHKSYIVNMDVVYQLDAYPGGKYQLTLKNGRKLPVGRTYLPHLQQRLV